MQHETSLRAVDEIARAGSIRGAAEKMAITPSALNRRLLAIEEELDVQLFERLASGVRLSAAGELFIVHARRQLADMKRLRSQIEDLKGARRGHVQIACDNSLKPAGSLARALSAYQSRYPGVSFGIDVLEARQIAAHLTQYRADLGYVLHPKTDANVSSLASAPARIAVVTRAGHPLAGRTPLRLEAALAYPVVLAPHGSLRALLTLAARAQRLALTPVIEADLAFARQRMTEGEALCFEVDTGLTPDETDTLVRTPLAAKDIAPSHVHLVQLRDRPLSVAAGRFAEAIKQNFASLSAEGQ